MNGEITGPLTLETWRLVNIVEGSRTRACMHWESKKKRNKKERRRGGRRKGGGKAGRKRGTRAEDDGGSRTRGWELSKRGVRCTTGCRGTLCREIIVTRTDRPGLRRRRRRNLWPCRRIFSRRAKLTTVRVTLFSSGNKSRVALNQGLEIAARPSSIAASYVRKL